MPMPASSSAKPCPSLAAIWVPRALLARDAPDDRPGDPAAVEWERGHEVEDQQQHVPEQQPRERQQHRRDRHRSVERGGVDQPVGPDDRQVHDQAYEHEPERRGRPGGGDPEVLAGSTGVAAHLREPTEQEQIDALHLDPLATGGERVSQFVHDQRAEQDQHGDHRGQVGDAVGAVQGCAKCSRQPEDHQKQDQEPATVHPDPEPEYVCELDRTGPAQHAAMVSQAPYRSLMIGCTITRSLDD